MNIDDLSWTEIWNAMRSQLACVTKILVLILVVAVLRGDKCSAARIYLSNSSVSPSIENPSLNLSIGEVASLYIWIAPDAGATVNGLGLSLRATVLGAVNVQEYLVYNPMNNIIGLNRWDAVGNGLFNEGNLLVSNSNAVSVSSATGINPSSVFLQGDPLAASEFGVSAYLHSKVDFMGQTAGQTDLFLQVGHGLITVKDNGAAENVQFGAGDVPGVSGGVAGATDAIADATIVVSTSALSADLNMDGFVDGLDLGTLLASWGTTTTPDMGELDGTPPVDGLDLGALLGAWNPPPLPSASSVPEPSTLMLTGLAAIGLFARRGGVGCDDHVDRH